MGKKENHRYTNGNRKKTIGKLNENRSTTSGKPQDNQRKATGKLKENYAQALFLNPGIVFEPTRVVIKPPPKPLPPRHFRLQYCATTSWNRRMPWRSCSSKPAKKRKSVEYGLSFSAAGHPVAGSKGPHKKTTQKVNVVAAGCCWCWCAGVLVLPPPPLPTPFMGPHFRYSPRGEAGGWGPVHGPHFRS